MSLPRSTFLALAVLAALAAGCRVFPQPPPGWDPSVPFRARDILEEAQARLGSPPDPLEDLVVRVRVEPAAGGQPREFALLWRSPDLWRIDALGTRPPRRVYGRGARGVEVVGGEVVRRDVSIEEVPVDRLLRSLFPVASFRRGEGGEPVIADAGERSGRSEVAIDRVDARGRRFRLVLDARDLTPLGLVEWIVPPAGPRIEVVTRLGDWRPAPFGGRVPRRLEVSVNGRLDRVLLVLDVDTGIGLRADDFEVPRR